MTSIQEWIECKNLPRGICNGYRKWKGLDPLPQNAPSVTSDHQKPTEQVKGVASPPSLLRRVWNFSVAAVGHVVAGTPKRSQEQIQELLTICQSCDQFDGAHCRVCGCNCNGNKAFFNKLAWADQKCPHPDGAKWGPVNE